MHTSVERLGDRLKPCKSKSSRSGMGGLVEPCGNFQDHFMVLSLPDESIEMVQYSIYAETV